VPWPSGDYRAQVDVVYVQPDIVFRIQLSRIKVSDCTVLETIGTSGNLSGTGLYLFTVTGYDPGDTGRLQVRLIADNSNVSPQDIRVNVRGTNSFADGPWGYVEDSYRLGRTKGKVAGTQIDDHRPGRTKGQATTTTYRLGRTKGTTVGVVDDYRLGRTIGKVTDATTYRLGRSAGKVTGVSTYRLGRTKGIDTKGNYTTRYGRTIGKVTDATTYRLGRTIGGVRVDSVRYGRTKGQWTATGTPFLRRRNEPLLRRRR
jgi:hypothetical protein